MSELTQARWFPFALLSVSNIFMTFAWYGLLRHKSKPLNPCQSEQFVSLHVTHTNLFKRSLTT